MGDSTVDQFNVTAPEPHKANPARIYDYDLGGHHNFDVDRRAAERIHAVAGSGTSVARDNRAFLHRVLRFCLGRGIDQFLDLGSGIPTVGNVHEFAQAADPSARVVYVDNEPVAVAHTRQLLQDTRHATILNADVCDPDAVLTAPDAERLLDFHRPIALLMIAVLHYVPPERNLPALLRRYHEVLAAGSVFAVSHITADGRPEQAARISALFDDTTNAVTWRGHEEIRQLFDGFDLVDPGLVWAPQWRPDESDHTDEPERSYCWAGVGVVPGETTQLPV